MIVKLIESPWTKGIPDGLTLNKEYIVVEKFKANNCDSYLRIIDDNENESAWNEVLFQYISKISSVEIRLYDHESENVKYKRLTENELEVIDNIFGKEWREA